MGKTLENEYFEWMYHTVCDGRFAEKHSYRKLLTYLHSVEYFWIIPDDGNRAADGEEGLRWRFFYENDLPEEDMNRNCSVLEMILAMAYRCEEIMDDASVGDRTVQWFWKMINNLGLSGMTDTRFDLIHTEEVIDRFLNRDFEPDGQGSLFKIRNCEYDLRDVKTWTAMLWYLDRIT